MTAAAELNRQFLADWKRDVWLRRAEEAWRKGLRWDERDGDAPLPLFDARLEQAVIGCILFDPAAAEIAMAHGRGEHFALEAHWTVFEVARKLHGEGYPVDLLTVNNALLELSLLDECGGPEYLTSCLNLVPTTAHIKAYIILLNEMLAERISLALAQAIGERDQKRRGQLSVLFEDVRALDTKTGIKLMNEFDLWGGMTRHLEQRKFSDGPEMVHFGITSLDEKLGGLHERTYTHLEGDTKEGKSQAVLQAVSHMGLLEDDGGHGVPVVYVSCEMDVETQAGPRIARFVAPRLATQEDLYAATTAVLRSQIYAFDKPGATIEEIVAELRGLKRREHVLPKLVVVDYIQAVQTAGGMEERFRLEYVAKRLKALAKELPTAMLVPSQITRREDGDVNPYGARAIRHAADRTILIQRPGKTAAERQQSREAKFIVVLDRDGEGGIEVEVDVEAGKFVERERRPGFVAGEVQQDARWE
jgi:replicative DNA helicase